VEIHRCWLLLRVPVSRNTILQHVRLRTDNFPSSASRIGISTTLSIYSFRLKSPFDLPLEPSQADLQSPSCLLCASTSGFPLFSSFARSRRWRRSRANRMERPARRAKRRAPSSTLNPFTSTFDSSSSTAAAATPPSTSFTR
jgi:hypothetical protein